MKYKSIEKIPYLTLPACSRKPGAEYVCRTNMQDIQEEAHLFLEIYQNQRECLEVPKARVVLTEKEFGTYYPRTKRWSRQRFRKNSWDEGGVLRNIGIRDENENLEKALILYSEEDQERIEKYCEDINIWKKECWWQRIDGKQEKIQLEKNCRRREREYKRRQQELEDRTAATPGLPEERILQYAEGQMFRHKHYLYYKKHGCRAAIACTACGETGDWRWKPGMTYETQFENRMGEPKHGKYGICPMCGAGVMYFAAGKAKTCEYETRHVFLGQPYKEKGMVIRYIDVEKGWMLEMAEDASGPLMIGAREKLSGIEIARAYFEPGKKVQIDFHKHNPYSGRDFWDDCNMSGNAYITIREAGIMPETYQAMKGSFLRYSALEEYEKAAGTVQVFDYMERYIQTPQIEMLTKMNLIQIVKVMIRGQYGVVANEKGDRIEEFLGIRKERIKMLRAERGNVDLLKILQREKRSGQVWTEEQIQRLAELKGQLTLPNIEIALKYMTLQKLLNRIEKYSGCRFETKCTEMISKLRGTAQTYIDYLEMREKMGYDLNNSVYQHPRDLRAAHDKMVLEQNKEEIDKRMKEAEEKYPNIRKKYRKLLKRYCYADDTYFIRPACSASEIVLEGRILHHCVGGDNYLGKHDRGTSYILMLRFRKKPKEPYITIEIHAESGKILQWYGAYDKKTDEEYIQKWIDQYTEWLEAGGKAEEEPNSQMLATA